MIKVSIIIPVYNVEKYIDECINSIVNQEKFNECELLLIDDGSTDNSGKICDSYTKIYKNVFCFHKKNEGCANARNYGLFRARGEYISFFDSDDYISSKSLSYLINEIEKEPFDILFYDGILVDKNGFNLKKQFVHKGLKPHKNYSGKEIIIKSLDTNTFEIVVWLGIYNKNFLLENKLLFDDMLYHEDEIWTPKVLLKSVNIRYLNKIIYYYRVRNDSIMRNCENIKHIENSLLAFKLLESLYDTIEDEYLKLRLKDHLVRKYLYLIYKWNMVQFPKLLKQIDVRLLKKWAYSKKNKIKLFLFHISPRFYCFIMKKFGDKKWGFT